MDERIDRYSVKSTGYTTCGGGILGGLHWALSSPLLSLYLLLPCFLAIIKTM